MTDRRIEADRWTTVGSWDGRERRVADRRTAPDRRIEADCWIIKDRRMETNRRVAVDRRVMGDRRGFLALRLERIILTIIHHPNAAEYGLLALLIFAGLSAVIYDGTGL
jgi:hypothetical protein